MNPRSTSGRSTLRFCAPHNPDGPKAAQLEAKDLPVWFLTFSWNARHLPAGGFLPTSHSLPSIICRDASCAGYESHEGARTHIVSLYDRAAIAESSSQIACFVTAQQLFPDASLSPLLPKFLTFWLAVEAHFVSMDRTILHLLNSRGNGQR